MKYFALGILLSCALATQAQIAESTLHSFCSQVANASCSDGSGPAGDLIQASDGLLYGTTQTGGAHASGAVFAMNTAGALTTVYSFCAQAKCADGQQPESGVIEGTDGNFYGTTRLGGASGAGAVYRLTRSGALTVLHNFCAQANCADGQWPIAALTEDTHGNFYGAAQYGGAHSAGTLFEITAAGQFLVLHAFCSVAQCADGALPAAPLLLAANGNGYGTTFGQPGSKGSGTIFEITPSGVFTTLHAFCTAANCPDGNAPVGRLVQTADGSIVGATQFGGAHADSGSLFAITPAGQFTTLHSFCGLAGCADGSTPRSGPVLGSDGNLYGVTATGGATASGAAYRITVGGAAIALYEFCSVTNCPDGLSPRGAVVQAADGNLYGTAFAGGNAQLAGLAFALRGNPALPPPVTITASPSPAKTGQPATVRWAVANAYSAGMQVCEAFVNGQPYRAVTPSGSQTFTPTAPGALNIAITCGGVESGFLTLAVQ
jgi:uncharacterized repeat protein (TIGR03803 family)